MAYVYYTGIHNIYFQVEGRMQPKVHCTKSDIDVKLSSKQASKQ